MTPFETELKKLNPRQREAVDAIEGPVMVIAGPGTGKTQILTLRIANILAKTDTPAEAILALTFTEAAAANMRRRLTSIIGSRGYYVRIGTFHGFCNTLIQRYPEKYPRIIGGRQAIETDAIGIVREIIENGQWADLKPFGDKFYYVPEILRAIKAIKQEGLTPEAFSALVQKEEKLFRARTDLYHEKGRFRGEMKGEYRRRLERIRRNQELAGIYAAYQEALRARKQYDFDDMILETIRAMEADRDFLLTLQEEHQYILVDEHQDTNGAQNKVLELLCGHFPNPNLFVVGDEKQAIFRFQGASLENFLYFKNKFESVRVLNLEENYRSTQLVLDAAQSLIEKNKAVLTGPLKAAAKGKKAAKEEKIHVWNFKTPEAELLFLSQEIVRLHAEGVSWNEIAVLYRDNRDVSPIADILASRGIPFAVESDRNLLKNRLIGNIVALAEAVYWFGHDAHFSQVLHLDFLGLDEHDVYRVLEATERRRDAADGGKKHIYDAIANPAALARLGLAEPQKMLALYQNLKQWKRRSENEELAKFFARLMKESGFLAYVLKSENYAHDMEAVATLYDEIKKIAEHHEDAKLRDFIDYLDVLRAHDAKIRQRADRLQDAARLMTAHKAKGLEFAAVFITGARDGHWGNRRVSGHFDLPIETATDLSEMEKNEDERRLFYMALTRAKSRAYVTYAETSPDGRAEVPSQFIGEIKPELREMRDGEMYEKERAAHREAFFVAPVERERKIEAAYFADLFKKRGLSATALNNYLACPWKYFYQNLLRIPQVPSVAQLYGIAMHKALQIFFDARNKKEDVGKKFLLDAFRRDLAHKPLSRADKEALSAKGEKALGGYFDAWNGSWKQHTINEFRITGADLAEGMNPVRSSCEEFNSTIVKLPPCLSLRQAAGHSASNGVKLTGNLDKLEASPDARDVTVVDYKTKQPKSRNWIEGKTKDPRSGDYKRQLVFYKLLLDLKPEKTYRMASGVIDFLEPDERGKYKKEEFVITDAEVKELKGTILRVADEITCLKFWNGGCGKEDCEFCKLREMMR